MDTDNNKNDLNAMLNALADGQLPAHEREEILAQIDKDKELSNDICEIYHIKDLIQTAYPLENYKKNKHQGFLFKYGQHIKVASYIFAFMFTLSIGYVIGERQQKNEFSSSNNLASTKVLDNKIIIFLSSSEPVKLTQALYKAETLAQKYLANNGEVYVVTSAAGIDLLNNKTTPFKMKIQALGNQYPTLQFFACNNTLYQRDKAGKHVDLVEEAVIVPSAVDFVAKHLQQGWQYMTI